LFARTRRGIKTEERLTAGRSSPGSVGSDVGIITEVYFAARKKTETPVGLLRYQEFESIFEKVSAGESEWYLVELGSGFDVMDVILIDYRPQSFTVYRIVFQYQPVIIWPSYSTIKRQTHAKRKK